MIEKRADARAMIMAAASRWRDAECASDDERRKAVHHALHGLAELGEAEYGGEAMAPVYALMAALKSLEQGEAPALLAPAKRVGRKPRELTEMGRAAAIAASVQILLNDGMPIGDAVAYVRKRIKRNKLSAKQIERMRLDVMGAVYGDDTLHLYREGIEGAAECQQLHGLTARQNVDALLRDYS
jgi:hypothetical protein